VNFHLAQVNIAIARYKREDPRDDFMFGSFFEAPAQEGATHG
jgi:hypothetical protein